MKTYRPQLSAFKYTGFKKLGKAVKGLRKPSGENRLEHDGQVNNLTTDAVPEQISDDNRGRPKKTKKVRKADPNVITVDVGGFVSPKNVQTDKTLKCGTCEAVLPSFSKFEAKEGTNNWLCEFCKNYNRDVDVTGWSKPTEDDVTYELQPPKFVDCKEKKLDENHNIIFVIDISGSMSSTKACDHVEANGRRTRTFISRLDAVKKAAEHQIRQVMEESPNVRVGLITFGTDVTVYGDGTTRAKTLSGSAIQNKERLIAVAADFPPLKPISETFDALTRTLMRLEIRGMTALGPGLLSAVSLASNIKGSKVIICTDGCANTGFGALPEDHCEDEVAISESRAAYKGFGEYARKESVTVSVISLEGTDCRLVHLGLVAQIAGGVVDIVDPSNMDDQFGNILASKTLATDVSVTVILHHTLYIRELQTGEQRSTRVEHLGSVAEDAEIVVEFGVKTVSNENEEPLTIEDEDNQNGTSQEGDEMETQPTSEDNQPSELPFQVQIAFTTREGGKYLRVVTNLRECTDRRETAESEINMNIVGAATSKTVSNVALAGNFEQAKIAVKSRKKMTERYSEKMPAGISESAKADVDDYMQDLDDLQGLVTKQERTTKQKIAKYRHDASQLTHDGLTAAPLSRLDHDGAGPPPPPAPRFFSAGMVQSAGMSMSSNRSAPYSDPSSAAYHQNAITDDLASEYYARSKGSYGQKKKSKSINQ